MMTLTNIFETCGPMMPESECRFPILFAMLIAFGLIGIIAAIIEYRHVRRLKTRLDNADRKTREADQALLRDKQILAAANAVQDQMAQPGFSLDEVLNCITAAAQELTGATGAIIELLDGEDLVCRAACGALRGHIGIRLKTANSLSGLSIAGKDVMICGDAENDLRVNRDAMRKLGLRAMIAAPLADEGRLIGALNLFSGTAYAFGESEKETVALFAGLIAAAISRRRNADAAQHLDNEKAVALAALQQAQRKLSHVAQYDQLTGLPNRALFMDRLHMAIQRNMRNHKAMALMFIDLDGFKGINDRLGQKTGDMVLKAFAGRLSGAVRMTDAVARLGGDEFAIILEEIANPDKDAEDIAVKIMTIMREPFNVEGHFLPLTASIGVCIHRLGPVKPDELIQLADTQIYKIKKNGKNAYGITAL